MTCVCLCACVCVFVCRTHIHRHQNICWFVAVAISKRKHSSTSISTEESGSKKMKHMDQNDKGEFTVAVNVVVDAVVGQGQCASVMNATTGVACNV